MNKNNKSLKFWAELEFLPNNTVKLVKANKLINLNQYKSKWTKTSARELARAVNVSNLVIK